MLYIGTKDNRAFLTNAASANEARFQIGLMLGHRADEIDDELDQLVWLPTPLPEPRETVEIPFPQ